MRRAAGAVAGVVLVTTLAGCSSGPSADDAAAALATALSHRTLAGVPLAGNADAARRDFSSVVAGLGTVRATVSVVDTRTSGSGAVAALRTRWTYDGRTTTSLSSARLSHVGNGPWRLQWTPAVLANGLGPGDVLTTTVSPAARGEILGAGGAPIVRLRPVDRFGIDKTRVSARRALASARVLAAGLGIDVASYVKQVRAAGSKAFVEALVVRRQDVPSSTRALVRRTPGASAVLDHIPLAPTRDFAAGLLGTVGLPTAEMLKKDPTLDASVPTGLSGLQARYDAQLAGQPEVRVTATRGNGSPRTVAQLPAVPGKPLRLTLDPAAQELAERALSQTTVPSALVAIRPSTGAVVASAISPAANGYDIADVGQYAPGSTFKVVSSLALLRAGIRPTTTVDCPSTTTVDGRVFSNYSDYPSTEIGRIPFEAAIANSCNTAVIGLRSKVSASALSDAAAALGLGVDHDTGFASFFGSVPTSSSGTTAAADLIGQGQVLASPLAMAVVASSVAHGSTVVPRMVAGVPAARPTPAHPLTHAEAAGLRTLMRAVVTQGSGSVLGDLPGPPVLAKTGTAEYGTATPPRTHAWMIAVHGNLAVAVFVEDGTSGSGTAGPILHQFLANYR